MIGRNQSDRNDVIGAGDGSAGSHRDHWVEVSGSQCVAQVSQIIRKERLHQCEVCTESGGATT